MDVHVDREHCVGAGLCALTAPQVFDQDEGLVLLLTARPPQERHAAVRVAAGVCPGAVITLTERESSTAS
ncbi:ferredoxin [Streptomyces sp. NPDC102274]|uniref:ferredoxin n=1 Tax=Streptomyces sp. NPDC102274 TaxID=3366151 RepID=UPI003800C202